MRINFNKSHLVAFGKSFENYASPYSHIWNRKTDFSQLAVCITGTPEYILEKLKKMVSEMEGEVGKPIQGQSVTNSGNTAEVITPVWEGEVFKTPEELNPPDASDDDSILDLPEEEAAPLTEITVLAQTVGRRVRVAREIDIPNNYIDFTEENVQENN